MLQTVEAEVDVSGNVRLLEPLAVTKPTRALVTLLEEVPITSNDADKAALLRQIAESMKANSFTGDPPRFSREDLHERR
ncbi:MAG: hypothetical protein U0Y68_26210 [Blastocatellia bacterium]